MNIKKKIIILGSGLSGLNLARILSNNTKFDITILEKEKQAGGLARSFKVNDTHIPIAYHHIKKCDTHFLRLLESYNLSSQLIWKKINFSFIKDTKIYPLTSPKDILFFNILDIKSKLKLFSFGLKLYFNLFNINRYTSAEEFIVNNTNEFIAKNIFNKLTEIKFSQKLKNISPLWLSKRLAESARSLGLYSYLKNGLHDIVEKIISELKQNNVNIVYNANITRIEKNKIKTQTEEYAYDILVSTIPPELLDKINTAEINLDKEIKNIKYNSMISIVFSASANFYPDYFNVFLDDDCTWGGIINHSFLDNNSPSNIYYAFKYLTSEDGFYNLPENEIKQKIIDFITTNTKIPVNLNWIKIFKIKYASPFFSIGYENLPTRSNTFNKLYYSGVYNNFPETRTMSGALANSETVARQIIKNHS